MIDNSVSARESGVLFKHSPQSTALPCTCLCAHTMMYLCFGRNRKIREVVSSGDYSQLNKDSDPGSTSYLLCDLDKLFDLIFSYVLVLATSPIVVKIE